MKKYLSVLILTTALLTAVLLAINLIADPYSQYGTVTIEHINKIKMAAGRNERLYKISTMSKLMPSTIILGTSREDFGINPADISFDESVYNGATLSQPYRLDRALQIPYDDTSVSTQNDT